MSDVRAARSGFLPVALPGVLIVALVVSGCASVPTGPSVMVLPGSGKSFEVFQTDDAVCRQWAAQQTGTSPGKASTESTVGGAAIGTLVGAAAGAALGAAAGNPAVGAAGAGGGAGAGGALLPAPAGPIPASRTVKTSNPAWIRRTGGIVVIIVSDGAEASRRDMLGAM